MSKQQKLNDLKKRMESANLPLKDTATQLVMGEGNPDADVYFLGEAPGRLEDETGLPFVGQAGKILTKLIESIGLKREDVYISSVVRYRPPKNRDPKPSEILAFAPFVDEEIKIIDPKVIVTLGRHSLKKFLPGQTINTAHGKPFEITYQGKKRIILPMYHPAAVLYRRELLKVLEEDIKKVKLVSKH